MKINIEEILQDIYTIDPSLQEKELELKTTIQKLFSSRPETHIDVSFQKDLKNELLEKFSNSQKKRQFILGQWLKMKAVQRVLGSVVLSVLVVMVSLNLYQSKKENSTVSSYIYFEDNDLKAKQDLSKNEQPQSPGKKYKINDVQQAEPIMEKKVIKGISPEESINLQKDKLDGFSLKKEESKAKLDQNMDETDMPEKINKEQSAPLEQDQDDFIADTKGISVDEDKGPNLIQRLFDSKKSKQLSPKKSEAVQDSEEKSIRSETVTESPKVAKPDNRGVSSPGFSIRPASTMATPQDTPALELPLFVSPGEYASLRKRILSSRDIQPSPDSTGNMLQNFIYNYPRLNDDVNIYSELSRSAWSPEKLILQLALQTRKMESLNDKPHIAVLILDIRDYTQQKLKIALIRDSLYEMTKNLRSKDKIGIIMLSGSQSRILEPTSDFLKIQDFVQSVDISTASLSAHHLSTAYKLALLNRSPDSKSSVIYLGDSDVNADTVFTQALRDILDEGISWTMLDISLNMNPGSSYQSICSRIGGQYMPVAGIFPLRKVLLSSLDYQVDLLATDFRYNIQFNPHLVKDYRILSYSSPASSHTQEENLISGTTTTLLIEISLHDQDSLAQLDKSRIKPDSISKNELGTVYYQGRKSGSYFSETVRIAYQAKDLMHSSPDFKIASAIALWNLFLTDSAYNSQTYLAKAIELADQSLSYDPFGLRQDFVSLLKASRNKSYLKNSDSALELMETK